MNLKVSATSSRDKDPKARSAFWLHVLIGLLLLWHYPVVWLFGFGDHIGRTGDPLLYCLGLFWGLVSAGIAMRWRWTIMAGLMMHFLTMLAPIGGLVVGALLLMEPPSRGHMAMSAGPAALFMILLSGTVALFLLACIYSLWRLLRYPWTNQLRWSGHGIGVAAGTVLMFVIAVGFDGIRQSNDANREAEIEHIAAHENGVTAIAFSPDGNRIATGAGGLYTNLRIRIWDTVTGRVLQQIPARRPVVDLTWSRNGAWLIAGCGEDPDAEQKSEVMVWDTETWDQLHSYKSNYLSAVALSPDHEWIAIAASEKSGGETGTEIRLYEPGNPEPIAIGKVPLSTHYLRSQIVSLNFTPDGHQLIAMGGIGLAVWNLPLQSDGLPTRVVDLPERVTSVEITPEGAELVYAASGTDLLYRISLSDMQQSDLQHSAGSHLYRLDHLKPNQPIIAMSENDEVLIAEPQSPVVQCLSWSTGEVLYSIRPEDFVSAIAISKDGAVAAVGTGRRVRLHDGRSGEFLRELIKP